MRNRVTTATFRLILSALLLAPLAAHAIAPTALKTEFLDNPLALDTAKPRFSWVVEDTTPGAKQTAYQVQAASSPEKLAKGEADLWDSGKVASDQSHLVPYAGKALASRQPVWWRVKGWDQNGTETDWSKPARFELGFLDDKEWQAEWITVPGEAPVRSPTTQAWAEFTALAGKEHAQAVNFLLENFPPVPLFRREFEVAGKVQRARLSLGVRGYAVPSLNGRRVSDRRLDPAYREYDVNTHYIVLDVTDQLRTGKNAIGIELGGGWHGVGEERTIGLVRKKRTRSECFIARLDVETDQGATRIVSDGTWTTAPGPTVKSVFFAGEAYDANREQPGWNTAGFAADGWQPAQVAPAGTEKLVPMLIPPERVVKTLPAVRKYQAAEGIWVFDFGQLFPGVTRLRATLPKGTTLIQRYEQGTSAGPTKLSYPQPPQVLSKTDGLIANFNGVVAGPVKTTSCYVYTAKGGDQPEEWAPEFDYQSLRYVEVTGYPGEPPLDLLTGLLIHTDFPQAGTFTSSDERINRVFRGLSDTTLYCTHGILQDNNCAERQKGNTGLMGNFVDLQAFDHACAPFHLKALDGLRLNTVKGAPPEILHERGRNSLDRDDTVGWHAAAAFLPWKTWLFFGDPQILERHYPLMKAYVERFGEQVEQRMESLPDWGDWSDAYLGEDAARPPTPFAANTPEDYAKRPPGQLAGVPFPLNTPIALTAAARFYGALEITRRTAEILGHKEEAEDLAARAKRIKEVFLRTFYDPTLKAFGSQAANADALQFGLAPEGQEAAVARSLREDVMVKAGGHASAGFCLDGIPDMLSRYGYADEAALLFQTDTYPSWGQILRTWGYHTMPARWPTSRQAKDIGGRRIQAEKTSAGKWVYDSLGGIRPSPQAAGFKHFELAPSFPSTVDTCDVSYPSPYGQIASAWKRQDGGIRWNVTIPWNTTATLKLPGLTKITLNGKAQEKSEFDLPAGKWEILAEQRTPQPSRFKNFLTFIPCVEYICFFNNPPL
jgi:alpha-L-rhamnosidase